MPSFWTDHPRRIAATSVVALTASLTLSLSASAGNEAVLTPIQQAAFSAVLSGAGGDLLTDPSDVLDLLAVDPLERAGRAQAQAARITGKPIPYVSASPDPRARLDPLIATKIAATNAAFGAGPAVAIKTTQSASFDFAAYLSSKRTRPTHRPRQAPKNRAAPAAAVENAINQAAGASGVSQRYLWRAAARESSFNPYAAASTSSARGLFQFIESTWLLTVKKHGHRYGLGHLAASIQVQGDGSPRVTDRQTRQRILSLRYDPVLSSHLAAAFTADNARHLRRHLGREPRDGELYVAHVLGASGAEALMRATHLSPSRPAASLLPKAASANRRLFYKGSGQPRSASELQYLLITKGES